MDWLEISGMAMSLTAIFLVLPDAYTFRKAKRFIFASPYIFSTLVCVMLIWAFYGFFRENLILTAVNSVGFLVYSYKAHRYMMRSIK